MCMYMGMYISVCTDVFTCIFCFHIYICTLLTFERFANCQQSETNLRYTREGLPPTWNWRVCEPTVCKCIFMYTYIYAYMYICEYIHIYMFICIYLYLYIHPYLYTHIHICIYTYVYVFTCTYL